MGCFTKTIYNLRSGTKHEYNKNLGDPTKLTTQTYYRQYDSYQTHNVNWSYGISRYEEMKSHIESYTGYDIGCVHVNDLGATYNALNEALGISDRALNSSQMRALYTKYDSTLPKHPQGKSAIQSKNNKRAAWHKLNSRGVEGGTIVVNLQKIKQKIEADKKTSPEVLEAGFKKIILESIEAERLQKIEADEENRLSKQLAEKVRQDEIKRNQIILKPKIIPILEPEIIPAVVASSILIPLVAIGLLLYSIKGKK